MKKQITSKNFRKKKIKELKENDDCVCFVCGDSHKNSVLRVWNWAHKISTGKDSDAICVT